MERAGHEREGGGKGVERKMGATQGKQRHVCMEDRYVKRTKISDTEQPRQPRGFTKQAIQGFRYLNTLRRLLMAGGTPPRQETKTPSVTSYHITNAHAG